MRVTMTETRLAAPDGVTVVQLEEGGSYDLPDDLAGSYVERGLAVAGEAKASAPAVEDKAVGAAPENKTAAAPRKRRSRKAADAG